MADSPPIIVVGGINMDIQARSARPFIRGDSNPGQVTWSPGGVGRNIAENAVALGCRVELVTVLGDDALSRELEASCARAGIGLAGALRVAGGTASQYICLLDADGALAGAVAAMDGFDLLLTAALEARQALLDSASLIVVDANIPAASLDWLAARYGPSRRSGLPPLALDPVSATKARRACPLIGAFAFAKPNLAEAAVLLGGAVQKDGAVSGAAASSAAKADPPRLAAGLRAAGLREVFLSLAREGIYYAGPGPDGVELRGYVRPPERLPEHLVPVNVSGAGDAACAALAWGYVRGLGIAERARLALAAAMVTAASPRTVSPELGPERLAELSKGVIDEPIFDDLR